MMKIALLTRSASSSSSSHRVARSSVERVERPPAMKTRTRTRRGRRGRRRDDDGGGGVFATTLSFFLLVFFAFWKASSSSSSVQMMMMMMPHPKTTSMVVAPLFPALLQARAEMVDGEETSGADGANAIVNFHRHHREVRKRLRERKAKRKRGDEEETKKKTTTLEKNDADSVSPTSSSMTSSPPPPPSLSFQSPPEDEKEEKRKKKLTSLFKEVSDRRRQEILAAMTDFAKTEAERKGEKFTDVRPESKRMQTARNEEKKIKEFTQNPSIEWNTLIEKLKKEDPTNPNIQPPIRTDDSSIIKIDYGTYDTCDTCELCHLGDAPVDGVEVNKHQEIRGNPGVSSEDMEDKSNTRKPVHCKECYGCNVRLSRIIKRTMFKGKSVQVFSGASGAAILKGKIFKKDFLLSDDDDDEGEGRGGKASAGVNHHEELEEADAEMTVFVKAWCNFGKYAQMPENPKSGVPSICGEEDENRGECHVQGGRYGFGDCNFKFMSSLDKLAHAANLSSVIPRSWTVEVKSFLPWDGFSTSGHKLQKGVKAQFYEKAPGVSIESVLGTLDPFVNFAAFKNISHDNVIRAATFDLLFTESDRHGQNVFFSDEGEITLIDNENTFGTSNSMLLPGHQKYEINRIGFSAIAGCGEKCPGDPKPSVNPMVALDYRCHIPRQYVGFDFPFGVKPFLEKIQNMSAKSVHDEFKMTREEHAVHLKKTVDEMLTLGFEGAMLSALSRQQGGNGYPIGKYGLKYWYPITKACCSLETCPLHTTRMKEKHIPDDEVTLKRDDPGVEATKLWGDTFEALASVTPDSGLERLQNILKGVE